MTEPTKILAAARFAAIRHHGQKRKGDADQPYVVHVLDVAERLAEAHPDDVVLILGGLLHDTVEDTETTEAELRDLFGQEVAGLVMEVTDDKSLPKAARKRAQVEHTRHTSDRAKWLKMADKASNLVNVARMPPDWTPERKQAYIDWALAVIDPIRGLDPHLEARFDAAVTEARASVRART